MPHIRVNLLQEKGPRNPGRLEATLLQLPRKKQGLPSSDNDLRPSPQNWSGNTESQNQTQTRSTSSMQQKVSRQSAFSNIPMGTEKQFLRAETTQALPPQAEPARAGTTTLPKADNRVENQDKHTPPE